jgi:O-succinylbenzoic acid--CoA ligase
LYQHAKDHPGDKAVVTSGRNYTFAELHEVIGGVVDTLQNNGVTGGSRVALVTHNSFDSIVLFWALLRIGAVACPINPSIPALAIRAYLQKINARVLYDPAGVVVDEPNLVRIETEFHGENGSTSPVMLDLAQDATIVATSGTSSTPKAALHTLGNHYFNAVGSNHNIQLQSGDRWLLALPLYHVGGLAILFRCWLAGAAVVQMNKNQELGECVDKFRISHLSLVPTQLRRLLMSPTQRADLRRLKAVLVGGAPVPEALIDKALNRDLPLHTTYGLTEMASQVCTTRPLDSHARLSTSGTLLPHRELQISQTVEILVRGETLFRGYVDGDAVLSSVDNDGWFHTGDMGFLDNDAYLTVHGRLDSMFISGGENIHPEEIERELMKVEGVTDVLVVPIDDREFGRRPAAFVMLNGSHTVSSSEINNQIAGALPRFKLPVAYYVWPTTSATGGIKPSRSLLSELVAQGKATPLA